MQFSIFDVQFKCTKDMFAWEKLKWTICVYWAQIWRSVVLGFIVSLLVGIVVWQSQLFQGVLGELLATGGDRGRSLQGDQVFIDWYHSTNILRWVGVWSAFGFAVFVASAYIQFYTLLKKQYTVFDRAVISDKIPQRFWSVSFWKRWIVSILYSLVVGFVFVLVMFLVVGIGGIVFFLFALIPIQGMTVVATIIGGVVGVLWYVLYTAGILLLPTHIALHGGTWGFVPVRKQPDALPGKQEV